jgi:hypothetical protein
MEENKYHFAREVIFNLRSCHAISNEVYLHWIDKLNNDEQEALRQSSVVGRSEQLPRSSSYEPCEGCDLSCPNWMPFFCDKK